MDRSNNKSSQKEKGTLFDFIISDRNIYRAIYALESYVDEPYLLDDDDLECFYKLSDKFNWPLIDDVIHSCQNKLKDILTNPKTLFDIKVYFRLKKFDNDEEGEYKLKYRPLHTAKLIDLICMVAILQVLMFEDSDETEVTTKSDVKSDAKKNGRNLSDLSKSIPENFYGNKPSDSVDRIFQKWQMNYQKYNQTIAENSRKFRKSHKYNYEVSLDIRNFFPSISPLYIHAKVCHELSHRYTSREDVQTLRIAVAKLLFLKVESREVENKKFGYYDDYSSIKKDKPKYAKGVAQGLPQSYFFGNICMTDIRRIIATKSNFKGLDYFYVDDSVIYVGKGFEKDKFSENIEKLNSLIQQEIENRIAIAKKSDEGKDSADKQLSGFVLDADCLNFHKSINYEIKFYTNEKSTCHHIDETEPLFSLSGIGRENYVKDFFNLDEVDDFISIEKLKALNEYIAHWISEAKQQSNDGLND